MRVDWVAALGGEKQPLATEQRRDVRFARLEVTSGFRRLPR